MAHRHSQGLPQLRVLHLLPLDAQDGEPGVAPVPLKVGDEVLDDGGGDHIPDVLGILVLEGLERNPHTVAGLVERGPPRVARIDGRIDLDPQQLAASMGVRGDLNPRHHAARHRDGVPPNGVTHDSHRVLHKRRGRCKLGAE